MTVTESRMNKQVMSEPEVSLWIAMKYICAGEACNDVTVSIDGAHIKTGDTIHFDIVGFMRKNSWIKCDAEQNRWQGDYQLSPGLPKIVITSKSGIGDVTIHLEDGKTLYIESKKFKGGNSGEYPAMREAIGQLMTNCPESDNVIPVVAVPYTTKSEELAEKWSRNERIRRAGIRFMLVRMSGEIDFI